MSSLTEGRLKSLEPAEVPAVGDAAAAHKSARFGARARLAAAVAVIVGASCSGPTKPGPPPPPTVGPATPPIIKSIAVPSSRVEAGTDVPITTFPVNGHVIWGVTQRITRNLLDVLAGDGGGN